MTLRRAWLAWDSLALFIVCIADLVSTLYWVHTHVATEANPWMSLWLRHGDFAFCAVKLLSFVPFLALCAYYRASRPRLIAGALRLTLVLYIGFYATSVGLSALHQ